MATEPTLHRVIWQKFAIADLDAIQAYLVVRSPSGARKVWRRIVERVDQLRTYPFLAPSTGGDTGARVLVVTGMRYLVVYIGRRGVVRVDAMIRGDEIRRK